MVIHDKGSTICGILASWLRENGERMRKWRENEEMERDALSTRVAEVASLSSKAKMAMNIFV